MFFPPRAVKQGERGAQGKVISTFFSFKKNFFFNLQVFFLSVLGIDPRDLYLLGKLSTAELHSQRLYPLDGSSVTSCKTKWQTWFRTSLPFEIKLFCPPIFYLDQEPVTVDLMEGGTSIVIHTVFYWVTWEHGHFSQTSQNIVEGLVISV